MAPLFQASGSLWIPKPNRFQWTAAIRNLIREGKIAQMFSAIQTGHQQGMQTLDQNLQELLAKGVISKEEARFKAANKENF